MVLVWPTIGTNGFSMVFPLETMVFQWFWVWQTIGTDGFSMVFSLETMVFQWFPMVANHWSNDGMVTIHRRGLHYCNIGIETPLPVPGAVVLQWSFFAPKFIRQIGVRTDKIRNGHDLGVVKPIKS